MAPSNCEPATNYRDVQPQRYPSTNQASSGWYPTRNPSAINQQQAQYSPTSHLNTAYNNVQHSFTPVSELNPPHKIQYNTDHGSIKQPFSQTGPYKASPNPPKKDVIELVNTDYLDYSEYLMEINTAIQPRNLGNNAELFKPISNSNQDKQKFQIENINLTDDILFEPVPSTENKQPKSFSFENNRNAKQINQQFEETEAYTPEPNSVLSNTREAKLLPIKSEKLFKPVSELKFSPLPTESNEEKSKGLFTETEAVTPKTDVVQSKSRQEKSLSSEKKELFKPVKFAPLPLTSNVKQGKNLFTETETFTLQPDVVLSSNIREAKSLTSDNKKLFQPVKFAPLPSELKLSVNNSPRKPKLFGAGV